MESIHSIDYGAFADRLLELFIADNDDIAVEPTEQDRRIICVNFHLLCQAGRGHLLLTEVTLKAIATDDKEYLKTQLAGTGLPLPSRYHYKIIDRTLNFIVKRAVEKLKNDETSGNSPKN